MSCKADAKYNFAKASGSDDYVYGAARPGAVGQRCYNPEDKVTPAEVEDWATFMSGHGVRRVVSLLSGSELATYEADPTAALANDPAGRFNRAVRLDAKAPGAADQLMSELRAAVEAKEKVVVHCWGGGGRTGQALAAWLVKHHGLLTDQACQQVEQFAKEQGASRRADALQVDAFLGAGTSSL